MAAVLGTIGGQLFYAAQAELYRAQSTLLLIAAGDETSPGGGRDRTLDVDTWATVARSTELLTEVADALDLELDAVRERSTAVSNPTGDVLLLTFEAEDEDAAVDGATVYADLFLATRDNAINSVTLDSVRRLNQLASDVQGEIAVIADQIDDEEAKGDEASQSRLSVLIEAQQRANERLSSIEADLTTLDLGVDTGRVLIDPATAVSRAGLGLPVIVVSGLALGTLLGLVLALVRDRSDDRFASAFNAEASGIREVGRVEYIDLRSSRQPELRGYDRLVTKFARGRSGVSAAGCVVLLLPVESRTLPADAALAVARGIEMTGPDVAMSVEVWKGAPWGERSREYWASTRESLEALSSETDIVLVPAAPMDATSIGLGFAAVVDRVVLVISADTSMRSIAAALDDLDSVDVDAGDVVVLTSVHQHHLSRGRVAASGVTQTA
ncbi:MAG: hypothetical protein R8G01_09315 [Ilumatobacteraceae bacterium]|nr:hypothetical protein [Ilumatobacteraceae bacterium]